jgi:putative glycosyltransferase
MKLSIVATLYNSDLYVKEFYRRSKGAAKKIKDLEYEIILVNDGSPDNSLNTAIDLSSQDPNVIVVDLSRNFGHHKAMMTGLSVAQGDLIFLIDSDLEEQPEWLEKFFEIMKNQDSDVVYGVQESRKGSFFEKISGNLWYWLFNYLSEINHPKNITTARLMSRRYVDALLGFREHELVISCLWVLTGFNQTGCIVNKLSLNPTNYSFKRKVGLFLNAIISFSPAPLKLIFNTGILLTICSFSYILLLMANYISHDEKVDGWTSVMISVWLLGGVVISFLGIISMYIAKLFTEVKHRPYSIIRKIYGR